MGVSAATVENLNVGAGDVWYKDASGVWQPVGATMEDNVFRIERDYADIPLNGVVSKLAGTDYITEERVFLECSLPEIAPAILALSVPGAVSTAETSAEVGGGLSTTLSDAITAGQYLAIKIESVTGLSVGDYIKVGVTPFIEKRRVTRVGTAMTGGTGIDVEFPFLAAHAAAQAVVEIDGLGGTSIVSGTDRRIPSEAYRDWRLDVPGLDGRMTRFFVKNALMTDNAEYTASDDSAMAPRVVLAGRRTGAAPSTSAWEIRKEAAFS